MNTEQNSADSPLLEIRRALRTARPEEDALEVVARGLMAYGHGSTEVRSVIDALRKRDEKYSSGN